MTNGLLGAALGISTCITTLKNSLGIQFRWVFQMYGKIPFVRNLFLLNETQQNKHIPGGLLPGSLTNTITF